MLDIIITAHYFVPGEMIHCDLGCELFLVPHSKITGVAFSQQLHALQFVFNFVKRNSLTKRLCQKFDLLFLIIFSSVPPFDEFCL